MGNSRLRFRAWDKVTKQIYPVWSMGWKAWGEDEINFVEIEIDGTVQRLEHEVELIQYTGLKDKHGVEIYESDIIGGIYNCSIEWCDKCASLQLRGVGCMQCGGDVLWMELVLDEEREVIGNKYQNPELMVTK